MVNIYNNVKYGNKNICILHNKTQIQEVEEKAKTFDCCHKCGKMIKCRHGFSVLWKTRR